MNDLLNIMRITNQVEKLILIKGNQGKTIEIYGQIRKNYEVFIPDTSIQIVEGNVICRNLPNGIIERYNVNEVKYCKGVGVTAHDTYLCNVIKML